MKIALPYHLATRPMIITDDLISEENPWRPRYVILPRLINHVSI